MNATITTRNIGNTTVITVIRPTISAKTIEVATSKLAQILAAIEFILKADGYSVNTEEMNCG
jgi:hypothetical protein